MNNELTYRRGGVEDKEQLMSLALIAYGQFAGVLGDEHWAGMKKGLTNEETFTTIINRSSIFVCTAGERIVGMACLFASGNPTALFEDGWCYIRLVGVHPDYEGRGIGKVLTRMCIDQARETNERTIALHTSEFQDAARHIYEGMGFTKLKEIGPLHGKKYWIYTLDIANENPA